MNIKIESSSNEFFKTLKKLHTQKGRSKQGLYLAEGERAVVDAASRGARVKAIVLLEGKSIDSRISGFKVYELSQRLYDEIKLTVNSQGIMAVIEAELSDFSPELCEGKSTLVYLDNIKDPGNMGTILRSAHALGADGIIISPGCVDVFNPKVVRSSMASILGIPIYKDSNFEDTLSALKKQGYDIIGTFPRGEDLSCDYIYRDKTVLVMGNEANGIGEAVEKYCTAKIKIPMPGSAESLNVATAATVMLYEILRGKIRKEREQ